MRLAITNQTMQSAEVQVTKRELEALVNRLRGTRNVTLLNRLTSYLTGMADRPVRIPVTADELTVLEEIALQIPR